MKLLDRYIIREVLTPFLFALGMFTFVFGIQPALHYAQSLLAKGVDLGTVGFLLLTLLPQALGLSLPMAFLAGLLMGLGRLSGDREAVALLACGVSPLRILRPVLLLAAVAGLADMYVLMQLIPDANQAFRVRTTQLLASKSESDIRPGTFYEGFPGKVLFIQEQRSEGGWKNVFLADTTDPGRPVVTRASVGYLEINQAERQVAIVLPGNSVRYTPGTDPGVYDMSRSKDLRFAVSAESVFGDGSIVQRGNREMRIAELRKEEARKLAAKISPHPEIIQRHQMFAFPVACLVFALVGLALGVHSRKEGKFGGFTLGLAVLFAYYGIMVYFEARTKGGRFPAEWARWMPNIILGIISLVAIRWRMRAVGGGVAIRLPWFLAKKFRRSASSEPASTTSPRFVVVIRIPDIQLPRPRLLDLYVGRRYLSVMALSFAGLLGLYYIGTVIDKSERLFKGTADGWMLALFLYYSTPQFLAYVIPMAILFAVIATAIRSLIRGPEAIASLFSRPAATLGRLDAAARQRPTFTLAALDAHAGIGWRDTEEPRQRSVIARPTYEAMFRTVAQAVVLEAPLSQNAMDDAASVLGALTGGRSFSIVRAFAGPASLRFLADRGTEQASMGGRLTLAGLPTTFRASVPQAPGARISLLANGRSIATGQGSLEHDAAVEPGVYRIEVGFPGASAPWIVSNPIVVAPVTPAPPVPAEETRQMLVIPSTPETWTIEREAASSGSVTAESPALRFSFSLAPGVPRGQYAALAAGITTASGIDRVRFDARASQPMRVSVQFRLPGGPDGRRWRRSVYLDQTPRTIVASLEEFDPVEPYTSQRPVVTPVQTLLIVVDTLNTQPGTDGVIWISNVALGVRQP